MKWGPTVPGARNFFLKYNVTGRIEFKKHIFLI